MERALFVSRWVFVGQDQVLWAAWGLCALNYVIAIVSIVLDRLKKKSLP